jgi:hypothetical protein
MEGRTTLDAEEETDDLVAEDPHAAEAAFATADDIRRAIEALTPADAIRIRKAAGYCLYGTAYAAPDDLVNEAVQRAMSAGAGLKGRKWPKAVPFVAFMIKTIQGLADDSSKSSYQRLTASADAMAADGSTADEALGAVKGWDHSHGDVVSMAVSAQEAQERQEAAKLDSDAIDAHFAGDDEIGYLIMGIKDDMKPAQIREISGMTATQYDTAMRRLRRGLDKLFPGRRKS